MTPAQPQAAGNPFGTDWWPSPWGPSDERGAANRVTPVKVIEATQLIKTGTVYQLGRICEPGMPLFGSRHYSLTIAGGPSGGPLGAAKLVYNDEVFSGEIGQVGTQFDGLGHLGTLIGDDYVITPADIQGMLRRQGLRGPGEGDVVLFHTGHGKLWMNDNATYTKGCPGPGVTAAKWLIDKKICLVGGDTWAVEAVPGEDKARPFECHQWWITMHGIYIHENLDLAQLAADRVFEFAYIFSPLRLKGATGSPGNPIAVI